MTETPEPVPPPHPAWVGGASAHPAWTGTAEEFHDNIDYSQAAQLWATVTCLNPICRAKNDVWADAHPDVITCWVCQRQTDLANGVLVPLPEPTEDEEVRAP